MKIYRSLSCFVFMLFPLLCFSQTKIHWWLTTNDKTELLTEQKPINFNSEKKETNSTININPTQKYQTIDGFGFALTGGSALHLSKMSANQRRRLLEELFGHGKNERNISYLRLSIGSSDLNSHTYSYDDLPVGETDPNLTKFSLREDEKWVIPVLKEILDIHPGIKILASPWSAPIWMKTNHNIQGGMLQEKYYPVYAQYFVKYIKSMQKLGIPIAAFTIQNEPFNDGNTPSMQFLAQQELRFIKNNLGPTFEKEGIKTKIILYDHNCDAPEYPIAILTDPNARKYIDGSGFHLYAGKVSALSRVHQIFPDKNLYFTEMMVVNKHDFNTAKPVNWIVIGAMQNWSRNVILWNLANNQKNEPHTDNGGCTTCQGAVTIEGNEVTRNLAYYTIGHFSEFIPTGSVRIKSTILDGELANVAFLTPQHKIVLVVANSSGVAKQLTVKFKHRTFDTKIPPQSTATYTW